MALLNLALATVNLNGSKSIFDKFGNCLETIAADGTSLIFAQSAGGVQGPPIWFAPSAALTLMTDIINGNADFQYLMNGTKVFQLYEVMLTLPDNELRSFFSYLSQHGIKLCIEGLPLVAAAGAAGDGIEGFSRPGDLIALLTKLKSLGGELDYVAWDEPYLFGHAATGLFSLDETAAQVAASTKVVKSLFPNCKIGDIEPIGGRAPQAAELQTWFTAYAAAAGSAFDFFQADIGAWNQDWQASLSSVAIMARAKGMSVNVIVGGCGTSGTALAWCTQAVAMAQQIVSDPSLRPDAVVVQSWEAIPGSALTPNQAGTLASVLQDVANGITSAAAIPAAAIYDASGLLKSVTWSGGWTASTDGTSLSFRSPTGALIRDYAWRDVRVFAFRPDTGKLSLTVNDSPITAPLTQPEHDSAFAISVAGGQFLFVPYLGTAAATSTSALTLGLSAISETGFLGSGITNQFNPTLSGKAAPNASIQLEIDGIVIGTPKASNTGEWTFQVTTPLRAGAHRITGSSGSELDQHALCVIAVDPTQLLRPTLALAVGCDTGYPGDLITTVTRPLLTGTADANVTLRVALDGVVVASVVSDGKGKWAYTPSALPVGAHTVTVTAAGPPGTSPMPATLSIVVDTAAHEAAMTSTDPLFDAAWYLQQHPDVKAASIDPLTHFNAAGWKVGYDPSPFFSTSYYLGRYSDVAAAGLNPLLHFEQYGWKEGRDPSNSFSTLVYRATHPSLPANQNPLVDYVQSLTVVSGATAPPFMIEQTPDQVWTAGRAFSLALSTAFQDPRGEPLRYSAALTSGQELPAWVRLDASTGLLSGSAPLSLGSGAVRVTATDTSGLSVTETFRVSISASPPVVKHQTAAQVWTVGQTVEVLLPADTFEDPQGQPFQLSAALANGQPLPSSLTFDPSTARLIGTAPITPATLGLKIIATNASGLASSETFAVTVKAAPPTVAHDIADQVWIAGQSMSFIVPNDTFTDPQHSALIYSAFEIGGQDQTSWMKFDSTTRAFTGAVPRTASGTIGIQVIATNAYGLANSETFGLTFAAPGTTTTAAAFTSAPSELLAFHS